MGLGPGGPEVFFQMNQCVRLGSGKPLSEECKAEVTGDVSGPYLASKAGKAWDLWFLKPSLMRWAAQ